MINPRCLKAGRVTAHFFSLAILFCFVFHHGVAEAALLARYTFDNAGNLGADSQGFANGTISGTVTAFTDAERGAVAQFNGASSGHIYSTIGSLPGSSFTLTAWVKSSSWSGNRGVFQAQSGGGATVNTTTKVIGGWVGNTGIAWGRVIDNTGAMTMPQSGPALTTGGSAEWHFLAYRGNGSTYEVFIDGSNVGTASIAYNGTLAAHDTLILGRQGNEAWSGLIDDFRVYNHALSDVEIQNLAIPEPVSCLLFGWFGLLALLRRRR